MKKFFILIFLVALLSLSLPYLTGLSYSELKDFGIEKYDKYFGMKYYNDIELEASSEKNAISYDSIKTMDALDMVKDNYATIFEKRYFNEEEKTYLYHKNGSSMYLALSNIVVLDECDYYEVILYELTNKKDTSSEKNILAKYYINSINGDIYDEATKPSETKVYQDNGLGIRLFIEKEYENNIALVYLDKAQTEMNGEVIDVTPLEFSYISDEGNNKLFTILCFNKVIDKDNFTIDTNDMAYFLGSNNKNTFILVKNKPDDTYKPNAKEILTNDFTYILKNIKVY